MNTNYLDWSICNLLLKKEKEVGQAVYLRQPRHDQWHDYTWAEVVKQARQVAAFLKTKGYERGNHIAIISKNCAEWFIADYGIALAGMVSVPLFPNQNQDNIQYILNHADVKLVFVGKLDDHQLIRSHIPDAYKTAGFDYHDDLKVDFKWKEILETPPLSSIEPPEPDDLYTIIYSSGTSGPPKGAVYTHHTIANYLALYAKDIKRISDREHHRFISYLPLAHVYERTAIQLGSLTLHGSVSFVESLEKFAENLREVQPTLFAAVPRIWGVFQQKIEQKLPPNKLNRLLKIPILSYIVKKKIRQQLGLGDCTNSFSGASHVPISILNFFEKLGIRIQEGYGQTENLAYATFSELNNLRKGYVGTPRIGVSIKLDENQELIMHSDCLMSGYYKNEEATKDAFTEAGWLRTGDIAEIDKKNRVKILGRLSEIYKNQKGEFVAPSPIEKKFGLNHIIENLCLIGQGLPGNVMVIQLSDEGREQETASIKEQLKRKLHEVNTTLQPYEKIKHLVVTSEKWTIENDLLTPTLKVKRRNIASRYGKTIQEAIKQRHTILWEKD